MSDALDKAKAAMEKIAELDIDLNEKVTPPVVLKLLDIASVHAQIAQATALERIAAAAELRSESSSLTEAPGGYL